MSAEAARENGTYIALGTNLPFQGLAGAALLTAALDRMADAGVKVLKRSSFWETAWQPPEQAGQPSVINAVALVDPSALDAAELYQVLAAIEVSFGRDRREKRLARTLDLDIIDFKGVVSETNGLSLPHPRAHERAFVLAPLAELAPAWRHPVLAVTASEALAALNEKDRGKGQEIKRLA